MLTATICKGDRQSATKELVLVLVTHGVKTFDLTLALYKAGKIMVNGHERSLASVSWRSELMVFLHQHLGSATLSSLTFYETMLLYHFEIGQIVEEGDPVNYSLTETRTIEISLAKASI